MHFDNLEYLSIENQRTDFPKHFHETFCISFIKHGIEQINFDHHGLFSEKGSVSITNPYEIHSNPLVDIQIPLSFDTIYLSNDLMTYLLNGRTIRFVNRKINDAKINQLFLALKDAMDSRNPKRIEFFLQQFVNKLEKYSEPSEKKYVEQNTRNFNEIIEYIEQQIDDKFCLEELAQMANINKYGFAKNFKTSIGMTPMNYILMKKIFACKNLIDSDSILTEIAYQFNFADMAHFSNTFKRYVGISPKIYQAHLTTKL